MLAEGYVIISKRDIEKILSITNKTVTVQDAVNSQWEIIWSNYYHYHDNSGELKYKVVYEVLIPFSEN